MPLTESSSDEQIKNRKISTGVIIKRGNVYDKKQKPLLTRFLEFSVVCHWVICFITLGLGCAFTFFYLSYSLCRHLIHLGLVVVVETLHLLELPHPDTNWTVFTESVYCLILAILILIYSLYWLHDWGAENRGGHPIRTLRFSPLWKYLANYFPIHMVLSRELREYSQAHSDQIPKPTEGHEMPEFKGLPTNVNYLVGYHPHGVFGAGAFVNFSTEATGFSKAFPGINSQLAILNAHFRAPFFRDYLMAHGIIAATKEGIRFMLDKNQCGRTGNFVVVVVGGAREALEARPNRYVMHISRRFGFFQLALETGSCLVPCISFGEQTMYQQISNEPGSWLRYIQDKITNCISFSLPLFYGRGPFPYRTPIHTVIGAPIPCQTITEPTRQQIEELRETYKEKLKELFHRYKGIYDPKADEIEFV